MSYTPVSIPKKVNGGRTKAKLRLLIGRIKDATTFPEPDDKGVAITGNLAMSPTASMINLEVTLDTISITQPSDGDNESKGFKPKIEVSRPGGLDIDFEEWCENNINEELFALVEYSGGKKKLAGYPGNPLFLSVESSDNKDADINKITLEAAIRGRRISLYAGTVPAIQGVEAGSGAGA